MVVAGTPGCLFEVFLVSYGWGTDRRQQAEVGQILGQSPDTCRTKEPAVCYLIICKWFLFLSLNIYLY